MQRNEITVSFACANSAMAAKMIEFYDKMQAASMEQLCDSLNNHPENWTEYKPDGTVVPAQPMNAVPPHVAQPNMPVSNALAAASASPTPYQSAMPAPQAPQASAPQIPTAPTSPAPPAPPVPAAAPPTPPAPYSPQPQGMPSDPAAPQQMSMPYTPMPSSAPVITREQLSKALQLFASSSQNNAVQVRELLGRYGVDSLTALPDASIPQFANSVRGMGCAV